MMAGGRPRIAIVTPLPPSRSGVAVYERDRLAALAAMADVDVFIDGRSDQVHEPIAGLVLRDVHELGAAVAAGGYAAPVLHAIGESPHHVFAFMHLMGSGGDVLLHDVGLAGLYDALTSFGRVGEEQLRAARAGDPVGLWCGPIVDAARRVIVHGEAARDLVLAARPARAGDVFAIPYATERAPIAEARDPATVCTFGHARDPDSFVRAMAIVARDRPELRAVIVGAQPVPGTHTRLCALAEREGLGDRLELTGWVDDREWARRLGSATVAVQLRAGWKGETSGTLADCLAAGVPSVATDVPASGALAGAVEAIPVDCPPEVLAAAVGRLLDDPDRRLALAEEGRRRSASHTFAQSAQALLDAVLAPAA